MYVHLYVLDGKLQDQVGSFKKEVTRLEFQNNELEKQIEELERGEGGYVQGNPLIQSPECRHACVKDAFKMTQCMFCTRNEDTLLIWTLGNITLLEDHVWLVLRLSVQP